MSEADRALGGGRPAADGGRDAGISPQGRKVLDSLAEVVDALEAGVPMEERFTVRRVRLDLGPREYAPRDVKAVRAALGASQPLMARLLGVDVKTVRSWEQGLRRPSAMARRFLDEIAAAPEHWRDRLRAATTVEEVVRPAGRSGDDPGASTP